MLLTIDSSAGASLALTRGETVLAAWHTEETTSHAEVLAPALHTMLSENSVTGGDLDAIAVGAGPGPFTGLRVGLALAHSLAEAWRLPLHGLCSLDALALRAVDAGIEGEFLAATDARRREVYWASYRNDDGDAQLVSGPHVGPPAEGPALPAVGAGAGLYPDQLRPAALAGQEPEAWTPHAAELGRLAHGALAGELTGVLCEPRPLYLRESDAKVPRQMRQGAS